MGCSESTQNKNGLIGAVAKKAAAIGAIAAGGLRFLGLMSLPTSNRKTMKAPGRNARIFRDVFENNPAAYFRDLRK